jgi:hypothetical protein
MIPGRFIKNWYEKMAPGAIVNMVKLTPAYSAKYRMFFIPLPAKISIGSGGF